MDLSARDPTIHTSFRGTLTKLSESTKSSLKRIWLAERSTAGGVVRSSGHASIRQLLIPISATLPNACAPWSSLCCLSVGSLHSRKAGIDLVVSGVLTRLGMCPFSIKNETTPSTKCGMMVGTGAPPASSKQTQCLERPWRKYAQL
jgi:hypothetical protein